MQPNNKRLNTPSITELAEQIKSVRLCDQSEFKNHLQALKKRQKNNQPLDRSLTKLFQKIASSKEKVDALEKHCPKPTFPDALPISQRVGDISKAIENNQVVIIAGETGSGKTTQLPKICLALGRGRKGLIGHTQPRRLATRTVSARIAEELKVKLGEQVGYKIRFDDVSSDKANILVMTDGMLLAEMSSDPLLLAYDTLIIDEAHERSLNIDFVLGYLHRLLNKRPDLKLIITSATIDPEKFSKHFNDAPIIEVSGRTYPVEVRYRPLLIEDINESNQQQTEIQREPLEALAEAVDELIQCGSGDILVFLPGEREIRDAAGYLRKRFPTQLDAFPLYSRLSKNDQDKIFKKHQKRRVVLATNVAETSLTVPGIRYVIDTGVARISRYNQRSKVQQLPIEAISQASANQRKGRCGRLEAGICIRLYAEDDFNNRAEFTDAEIHRTNLASVILKMLDMGLGNIELFPFVEPPEDKRVSDGFRLLQSLQAVDQKQKINPSGKKIAKFPVDPRFAKMLLTAEKYGCVKELLIIVSALSVQDVRERPLEKRQQADELHRRFNSTNSDFVSILNLWNYCHHIREGISSSQFRKKLSKQFISFLRLRDWMETYRQLSTLCKNIHLKQNQQNASYASIHKAIISGLPDQLGTKSPEGDYLSARNSRFVVNRQSAITTKNKDAQLEQILPENKLHKWQAPSHKWIVAAELVETQKVYARQVAAIDPDWVIEVALPLIKRRVYDPFWSAKSGCCKAYLQQSIFGLILCSKKVINYEQEDLQYCREMFLREGLIERQLKTKVNEIHLFWDACDEISKQEDKTRRRDRLLDNYAMAQLLNSKIPMEIVSIGQFHKWYKKASSTDKKKLLVSVDELLKSDAKKMPELPEFWQLNEVQLPISYLFEPGAKDDGMTIKLPLALLPGIEAADFEYLIPSLLKEKIIALLKGLPKRLRKNFVPVPDFSDALIQRIKESNKPEKLHTAICRHLKQITGVNLTLEDLESVEIPEQLKVNFNVIDEDGKTLVTGRDLKFLQQHAESRNWKAKPIKDNDSYQEPRKELLDYWPDDFQDEPVEMNHSGIKIRQFPGLSFQKNQIKRGLFSSASEAKYQTNTACMHLLKKNLSKQCGFAKKQISQRQKISLGYSSIGNFENFVDDLCWSCMVELKTEKRIQTEQQFTDMLNVIKTDLVPMVIEQAENLVPILEQLVSIKKSLKGKLSVSAIASYNHISTTLEHLIFPGFIKNIDAQRLANYKRYLQSLMLRLEKLPHNANRERSDIEVINHWNEKLTALKSKISLWSEEYQQLRQLEWMLDELSVSLFTQELGTAFPISEKRLRKQYNSLVNQIG